MANFEGTMLLYLFIIAGVILEVQSTSSSLYDPDGSTAEYLESLLEIPELTNNLAESDNWKLNKTLSQEWNDVTYYNLTSLNHTEVNDSLAELQEATVEPIYYTSIDSMIELESLPTEITNLSTEFTSHTLETTDSPLEVTDSATQPVTLEEELNSQVVVQLEYTTPAAVSDFTSTVNRSLTLTTEPDPYNFSQSITETMDSSSPNNESYDSTMTTELTTSSSSVIEFFDSTTVSTGVDSSIAINSLNYEKNNISQLVTLSSNINDTSNRISERDASQEMSTPTLKDMPSLSNSSTIDISDLKTLATGMTTTLRLPECYDGPSLGVCMYHRECLEAGGKAFAICSNGRFCCQLYDFIDRTGVAHECGKRSRPIVREAKIVGGSKASYGEFPWQAYIFFTRGRAFCGGTLINEQWIVTAAHCVFGLKAKYIHVRLGDYDLSHNREPYSPLNRNVKKVIPHPSFNARGENDIALLWLNSPIEVQPNVIPICLPQENTTFVDSMGIVTGWGTTKWNGYPSDILQKATLPILPQTQCQKLVEGYHSSFLCAGYTEGTADACMGDSGGPLQVRQSDTRYYLAGVVSWGDKCAQKGKVGVYTSVIQFLPWISRHINNN